MFCHQCGKDLIETACFCPNCGAKRLARTAMPAPQINSECVATSHPNTTSTQSQGGCVSRWQRFENTSEIVFAHWGPDGYYYPAYVKQAGPTRTTVEFAATFMNGQVAEIGNEYIADKQEVLVNFKFQGNWQNLGRYYWGKLISLQPLTMKYYDKTLENIDIRQIRVNRRKKPRV